jgi:ribosomal-protein-alanine N-acetyltransferase
MDASFIVSSMEIATTDRLVLRRWKESDREPFSAINADPRVMEFMPGLLSRKLSDQAADRIEAHFAKHGFGLYAAELRADRSFIGFIGLSVPNFHAAFTPCVEIGWRLAAHSWGQGLATEGAKTVATHAFRTLGLESLVSFTTEQNVRSRRVMEKLGMAFDPAESFDHPNLPPNHPLRRHVLYRLQAEQWVTP